MAAAAFSPSRQGLHVWAILTLAATFILLCSGGIVTSKGVGMSVPDWPTTYGYNMFLFPISRWVGGIFYEHAHRLIASGVGLMTMILAAWLLASDPRRWVKILGIAAFVGVCIQGLLGGLRVTLYKDEIGIFHALLAQAFFCLIGILTVVTSRRFIEKRWDVLVADGGLRTWAVAATVLIFLQLGLGATMRHEHAGLAIKDFPLAYGAVIPDTSPETLARINAEREAAGEMPTNAEFIWVQMAHRLVALLIVVAVGVVTWRAFHFANARVIRGWTVVWSGCVAGQIVLGAWTIWSNKAADIATAHMALGALTLLLAVIFCFRLFRSAESARFRSPDPQPLTPGLV